MSIEIFHRNGGRLRKRGALLTLVAYASTLVLAACGGGSDDASGAAQAASASAQIQSASRASASAASGSHVSSEQIQQQLRSDANAGANSVRITATKTDAAGSHLSVLLPAGSRAIGLKVVLNGRDVSARFGSGGCDGANCVSAVVSGSDGVRAGKNVVYATAKDASGASASGRLRFAGADATTASAAASVNPAASTGPRAKPLSASTSSPTASQLPAAIAGIPDGGRRRTSGR